MKTLAILILILGFSICVDGQNATVKSLGETEGRLFLPDGVDFEDEVPERLQYMFADFIEGAVYYEDGDSLTDIKLNVSLLDRKVYCADSTGHVRIVPGHNHIDNLIIGEHHLIRHGKNFVIFLASYGKTMLIHKTELHVAFQYKVSGITGINYSSHIHPGRYAYYALEAGYALTRGRKEILVDAETFRKVFPKVKWQIDEYLMENDVDYENEEDVMKFFEYCSDMDKKLRTL